MFYRVLFSENGFDIGHKDWPDMITANQQAQILIAHGFQVKIVQVKRYVCTPTN